MYVYTSRRRPALNVWTIVAECPFPCVDLHASASRNRICALIYGRSMYYLHDGRWYNMCMDVCTMSPMFCFCLAASALRRSERRCSKRGDRRGSRYIALCFSDIDSGNPVRCVAAALRFEANVPLWPANCTSCPGGLSCYPMTACAAHAKKF